MKPTPSAVIAAAVLAAGAASARAEYVFTFSGTVISGNDSSTGDLTGSDYTIRLFVSDLAADLTPSSTTANYAISSMQVDLGSDGSNELTLSSGFSAFNSVYIDPGATQLVGAMDLFGPTAAFILGVHIPSGSFTDPKNLAGESAFSLSSLTSSTLNYINTPDFNAVLDTQSFSFGTTAVVPLPTPVAMTGLGLIAAGFVARRRSKRTG